MNCSIPFFQTKARWCCTKIFILPWIMYHTPWMRQSPTGSPSTIYYQKISSSFLDCTYYYNSEIYEEFSLSRWIYSFFFLLIYLWRVVLFLAFLRRRLWIRLGFNWISKSRNILYWRILKSLFNVCILKICSFQGNLKLNLSVGQATKIK